MTSSLSVRFTPRARRDLRLVLRYSLVTWGERQRDAYAERLSASIDNLTRQPDLGRAWESTPPGLHSFPSGEHVVYYRFNARTLSIIRILHRKMDPTGKLGPQ